MSEIDIFNSAKPQSGEFFKFKDIGDSVQGTYIDVREGTDSFNNQQTIYVLSDATGKIWNLGFRQTAEVIHERMKGIRFGQIVGFRFDEERDSKRNPGTKVKIIRIYADPKLVDQEWLKQQAAIEQHYAANPGQKPIVPAQPHSSDGFDEDFPEFNAPADVEAASSTVPAIEETATAAPASADPLVAIRNLAKTKGLAAVTMTDAEVDAAVIAFTGLPLTEENLTQTIIKLASYSK